MRSRPLAGIAAALAILFTNPGTSLSEVGNASAGPLRTLASFNGTFQTGTSFTVTWGGSMDTGSGVASYSISVRRAPFNGTFGPWEPFQTQVLAAPADPVIAAAGDIACGKDTQPAQTVCKEQKTADVIAQINPNVVLPLGDIQYEEGETDDYMNGIPGVPNTGYNPTWGRFKAITRPVMGNHEYSTANPNAEDSFDYFNGTGNFTGPAGDRDKGYYSFDLGAWHIIALNSQCSKVGLCTPSSPQYQWLSADLAANRKSCTLAFWHAPLFSSGTKNEANSSHFWQLLYNNGADLILNGHEHFYERFAPQTPAGVLDPTSGIRQFIVGTGGKNLTPIGTPVLNSQVRDNTSFGVLKLTLHPKGYDWEFVPIAGRTFTDSGSTPCHGIVADTTAPTAPTMNGAAATGSATFTGEPGFTYCFQASATDREGNTSQPSAEYCTAIPVDNVSFKHWGGWIKKRGTGHYIETFSQTRRFGATMTLKNVTAKHLVIIVTKCPKCGVIQVYFGGKLLRRIQLRSSTTKKFRTIELKTFDSARIGTVKVKVMSDGKLVKVDGLGVSAV